MNGIGHTIFLDHTFSTELVKRATCYFFVDGSTKAIKARLQKIEAII
jgi:hypothetical protein